MQPVLRLVPDGAAGPVEDRVGDLVAAVGGQAVQRDRTGRGAVEQGVVHLQRAERRRAVAAVGLLAHRDPGVGDDDLGTLDGRVRVGDRAGTPAGLLRAGLRVPQDLGVGGEPVGRAHPDVQARGDAAEQQRVRHVVRAVAEVGQGQPGEAPEALADRLQVGQHLAGVEGVGERVHDRDGGGRGHLLDPRVRPGAPHDRRGVARHHPGGVGDRLAAAQLAGPGVDDHRRAAELGDAGLEGQPGAGGRLVEQHRDRARALQGAARERRGLERVGQVQDLPLLGRGEVVVAEQVPKPGNRRGAHEAVPSAAAAPASRNAGSAPRNSRACASLSTRGGMIRSRSGTALLSR